MAHAVRRQVLAALEDFDDQRACQLLRSRKWERHQLLRADVLHRAAANGCVNAMRYLISEVGVPVDALDDLRRTPICLAAREVRLEATELLLTLGADPNPGFVTALESHAYAIVKVLLAAGVKPTREAFSTALQTKTLSVIEALLAAGADPEWAGELSLTNEESDACLRLLHVCRNLHSFTCLGQPYQSLSLSYSDIPASLTSLNLYGTLLTPIDPLSRLERLRNLAITHTDLTELPVGLFRRMSTLHKLDLFDNRLRALPWLPITLRRVKLYYNCLTQVPARLVNSVPLVSVMPQHCRFESLRHPRHETHVPTLVELALTVLEYTRHAARLPEPLREMHQWCGLFCDSCSGTYFGQRYSWIEPSGQLTLSYSFCSLACLQQHALRKRSTNRKRPAT